MVLASSSPLSTTSSDISFYTADASGHDVSGHDISTSTSPDEHEVAKQRRKATSLPLDLKNQSDVLLEEELYRDALALFTSILSSGGLSQRHANAKPIVTPGPRQLALINTLTVHPNYTTRPDTPEQRRVSARALSYLYTLLETVGPVHADFRSAFRFQESARLSRRGGRHNTTATNSDASDLDDESRDHERLRGKLANQGSLWSRGHDLWSVVGWAFNCSVKHPKRWPYWRLWLTFMTDVLQEDWRERTVIDHAEAEVAGAGEKTPTTSRQDSLIAMYLAGYDTRQRLVDVLKAVDANGDARCMATYPEVFFKEPHGRKKDQGTKRKFEVLLANDGLGHYDDDDDISSGASQPPTPQKRRVGRPPKRPVVTNTHSGTEENTDLRLRLFQCISAAVYYLWPPERADDLYEAYCQRLLAQPLATFTRVVTSGEDVLPSVCRVTIIKYLFARLLPRTAKTPSQVDKEAENLGRLTGKMVEHCFAGHAANSTSVEENAKLSVLVESSLQSTWVNDDLAYSDHLDRTVKRGIEAREAKVKRKGASARTDSSDGVAWEALSLSSERIRILMEVLRP